MFTPSEKIRWERVPSSGSPNFHVGAQMPAFLTFNENLQVLINVRFNNEFGNLYETATFSNRIYDLSNQAL